MLLALLQKQGPNLSLLHGIRNILHESWGMRAYQGGTLLSSTNRIHKNSRLSPPMCEMSWQVTQMDKACREGLKSSNKKQSPPRLARLRMHISYHSPQSPGITGSLAGNYINPSCRSLRNSVSVHDGFQ